MHLNVDELRVFAYEPEDGTTSAAIKLSHRHSQSEIVRMDTASPRENLRAALEELVEKTNPNPAKITTPSFYPFDLVEVTLPESFQDGVVSKIDFDFHTLRWKYTVNCNLSHASGDFDAADLSRLEDDEW